MTTGAAEWGLADPNDSDLRGLFKAYKLEMASKRDYKTSRSAKIAANYNLLQEIVQTLSDMW